MRDKKEIRVNLSELLNKGNWILLFRADNGEEKINCQITSFMGDNNCIIESDDILKDELPLDICIHHGTTDGLYKIDGVLEKADNSSKIILTAKEKGFKIREREFIRLDIQKEAKMSILNHPAHKKSNLFSVFIEDISAAGAKIKSEKEVLVGFFVEIDFSDIKEFPFNKLTSEILWNKVIEKNNKKLYEAGVHFVCSARERNQIADYVEQKQLEYREKGEI